MDEKPKQIFGQNENGKFENKTCNSPPIVDIDELKRENKLLKEKLKAIQSDTEGTSSKPPKATSSAKSLSSEDLSSKGNATGTRSRSKSCKGCKSDNYWRSCAPELLPCRYNPQCYSKNNLLHNDLCDCLDDEYLSDMVYRYPDYFSRGLHWPRTGMRSTRSYEDINRILDPRLDLNALYTRVPSRRLRPRTRSVEGCPTTPPPAIAHTRLRGRTCEDPAIPIRWADDPYYFDRWKCSVPRIPFRPRSVWDISLGMKVSMHRSDGRLSRGIVRWIGLLPNLAGEYVGVELETQTGRHDGYLNGVRYFKCKENCGIFVKFTKIIMAWR